MKPCLKPETRRESRRVFASKSLSVLVPPRRIERPARGLGNRSTTDDDTNLKATSDKESDDLEEDSE